MAMSRVRPGYRRALRPVCQTRWDTPIPYKTALSPPSRVPFVGNVLGYAPIAAVVFGVPQLVPQIRKLRSTGDGAGVSRARATLSTVSNAAWIVLHGVPLRLPANRGTG
jgi:hypothetical protein